MYAEQRNLCKNAHVNIFIEKYRTSFWKYTLKFYNTKVPPAPMIDKYSGSTEISQIVFL